MPKVTSNPSDATFTDTTGSYEDNIGDNENSNIPRGYVNSKENSKRWYQELLWGPPWDEIGTRGGFLAF